MMNPTTEELVTNVKALAQTMKYASRPSRGILLDAAADRLRYLEGEVKRLRNDAKDHGDALTIIYMKAFEKGRDAAYNAVRSLEGDKASLQESVREMREGLKKARVLVSIYADGSMAKKITNDLDDLLAKYPNPLPKE